MKKVIQTKLDHPETYHLDRECKWGRPEFSPVNGLGEQELWALEGLIVALGFIDDEQQKIIGSGAMIAPGLCLTATHVIDETQTKNGLIYSFPCEQKMRAWTPIAFHAQEKESFDILPFQKPQKKFSDVGILSNIPFSKFDDNKPYQFAPLEASTPKINERLWATGYREIENDGVPTISFFVSSGLVTELYLDGRGNHIHGPCVEVAMEALGGMSGGPVFNSEGRIVGVVSSSLEGDNGPTYVSLIWTSLLSEVYAPWPKGHWPNNLGGIQTTVKDNGTRLQGSARITEEGSCSIKFHSQTEEMVVAEFRKGNLEFSDEFSLDDLIYNNFEPYLEDEGIEYFDDLEKSNFDTILKRSDYHEILNAFDCIESQTFDGIEDLSIESALLLENKNIGIDALFNIKGFNIKLRISNSNYEFQKEEIEKIPYLNIDETDSDFTYLNLFTRPYFRVNFTFNTITEECEDIRFHYIFLRNLSKRKNKKELQ